MAMPSSHMYVEGVELNRMGQNLTLARYPIHWHLVGDAKGQYKHHNAACQSPRNAHFFQMALDEIAGDEVRDR